MKFKTSFLNCAIFLIITMLLFITPVNALEYNITDFTDFNDINEYDGDYMLVCGANSYYGSDAVSLFNPITGTGELKIYGFDNIQSVGYDGVNIYWGDGNKLYMYNGGFLLNGSYHNQGIGEDYLQLATVTYTITDIYIDSEGGIYFTDSDLTYSTPHTQSYIYKCVPPTYAITEIYHRTSGDIQNDIQISNNMTNLIIIESYAQTYGGDGKEQPIIRIFNSDYSVLKDITFTPAYKFQRCPGLYSTINNDIYFVSSGNGAEYNVLHRLNFSNNYEISTIANLVYEPTGMLIDSNGIIYISFTDGYIRNYLTVDMVGGYSTFLASTGLAPSSLTYDISTINSMYDTYFNNSNIVISYNIETELLSNDNEDLFNNYMRFRIDLLHGTTPINTEYIETVEFSVSLGYLNIYTLDVEHRYSKDGTITYTPSPNWDNGEYTVKLYEITNDTISQIDADTYTVLETQSNVSITTTEYTPSGDVSEITNKLMSSNLFYAGIIIMAFTTIGAVYGSIGAAIGGFVGTVISYGVDLIPEWVVLAIVILLIVVGAILVSKGGD